MKRHFSVKTISDFFYLLGRIAFVFAFILFIYFFYLLFWPVKTIVYRNLPFPTEKQVYAPGENVTFTASYCKYITGQANVIIGLEDGALTTLGSRTAISIPGCHVMESSAWEIPPATPPGQYKLVFISNYQVNQFRTIQVTSYTQEFTVK